MAYPNNNFAGVPFKTLLDKGHKQYRLAGVETEILQFPCAENGMMAIFRATVKNEDGHTFSGHGDADPNNTTKAIAPHLLRMAETRAIARALRWLTNSGETARVEISGDEDEAGPNSSQPEPPDVGGSTPPDVGGSTPADVGESTPADRANAKAEFLNRSQSVIAKIDDQDQVAIVLTTCGYDTLDAVKPEDCRRVYYALKEKYIEMEEKRAATKLAAN